LVHKIKVLITSSFFFLRMFRIEQILIQILITFQNVFLVDLNEHLIIDFIVSFIRNTTTLRSLVYLYIAVIISVLADQLVLHLLQILRSSQKIIFRWIIFRRFFCNFVQRTYFTTILPIVLNLLFFIMQLLFPQILLVHFLQIVLC